MLRSFLFSLFMVVLSLFQLPNERIIVTGCVVQEEGTQNNQSAITYYTCDNKVSFILVSGSPGALHLQQNVGKRVDVKIEILP